LEAAERGVTIQAETELALVDADAVRLGQVIGKLITNAVQFTDSGGAVVIRAGVADDALELSIQDTGIGVAPEEREQIFDPFHVGQGRQTAPSGAGIGLALARGLVNLHGGDISLHSEPGRGSTFTVRLPLAAAASPAAAELIG